MALRWRGDGPKMPHRKQERSMSNPGVFLYRGRSGRNRIRGDGIKIKVLAFIHQNLRYK
jgi:hypothetical protein